MQQASSTEVLSETESNVDTDSDLIDDLDIPYHDSIVTMRLMTKRMLDGEVRHLYQMFAGILAESVNISENDSNYITTERVNNDDLFDAIEMQCNADLLTTDEVMKAKNKKLLEECCPFIVTSSMPTWLDGKMCLSSIKPVITSDHDKILFSYVHPSDPNMKIVVHEPSSPPKVDYRFGDKSASTSNVACYKVSSSK